MDEITAIDAWAVDRHADYPDQVRIIGPTLSGRMLTVAMEPAGNPGSWRPITGWTPHLQKSRTIENKRNEHEDARPSSHII